MRDFVSSISAEHAVLLTMWILGVVVILIKGRLRKVQYDGGAVQDIVVDAVADLCGKQEE